MQVRPATPNDAQGIAEVHVASWQTTYAGHLPDDFLKSLTPERRLPQWQQSLSHPKQFCFVAEDDTGRIIGFVSGGPSRDDLPAYDSELYAIYLLAEYQGKGTGRALITVLVRQLLDQGYQGMLLWVLSSNQPSRAFYERMGGTAIAEKTFELAGVSVQETAYGWPDLKAFPGVGA